MGTPLRMSRPKFKIRRESHQISNVRSSPENNLRMAELFRITTSKRNQPFTWCLDFVVVKRERRSNIPPQRKISIRERRRSFESLSITRSMTPEKSPDSERNAQSPDLVISWPITPTVTTLEKLVTLSSLINQRIRPK